MKSFLILILFSNFIFSQHKDIYGLWHNSEGEYVRITENNDFVRYSDQENGRLHAFMKHMVHRYKKKNAGRLACAR